MTDWSRQTAPTSNYVAPPTEGTAAQAAGVVPRGKTKGGPGIKHAGAFSLPKNSNRAFFPAACTSEKIPFVLRSVRTGVPGGRSPLGGGGAMPAPEGDRREPEAKRHRRRRGRARSKTAEKDFGNVRRHFRNLFRTFPFVGKGRRPFSTGWRPRREARRGFRTVFLAQSRVYFLTPVFSLSTTSWAPPSTMLVAETKVSLAFFWSSGMVTAPQLHMVWRTLLRVRATLSWREPA